MKTFLALMILSATLCAEEFGWTVVEGKDLGDHVYALKTLNLLNSKEIDRFFSSTTTPNGLKLFNDVATAEHTYYSGQSANEGFKGIKSFKCIVGRDHKRNDFVLLIGERDGSLYGYAKTIKK